jgi:hypothetical protein
MGGIIEDYIILALRDDKLTTKEVNERLKATRDDRKYGTISHHLRKMAHVQILRREKRPDGQYVYWNPCEQEWKPENGKRLTRKVVVKWK